jgi:Lipocalin-like domain
MKLKAVIICAFILFATASNVLASDPKLEGAYKWVSTTFPGGKQTEAEAKGMIVVHGKYMAYVKAGADRKTWSMEEPEADRMKKIAAAYQNLNATAGSFDIEGNVITLHQLAQASPVTMGKDAKWEFKLEGNKLTLKPVGNANVEFTFERLP